MQELQILTTMAGSVLEIEPGALRKRNTLLVGSMFLAGALGSANGMAVGRMVCRHGRASARCLFGSALAARQAIGTWPKKQRNDSIAKSNVINTPHWATSEGSKALPLLEQGRSPPVMLAGRGDPRLTLNRAKAGFGIS